MLNKNFLLSAMIVGLLGLPAFAETLTEVIHPKSPAYRVGISELPEQQYVQAQAEKIKPVKKYAQLDNTPDGGIADRTYADLSIKNISREIAQELEFEEEDMLADLSLLWQGAAKQSDTINFALYKLANPDADKPDEKSIKKVLTTIASMSTLVGAGVGSPILAGSSLIGGNILKIMSQDTKALNYKYTRVNDADMIILIRKVEDLQQTTINLYYDYLNSKKQYEYATKLVEDREYKFNLAQKNNAARELVVITDAYYRTALDKQRSAKSEFFAKRAALEQFVGNETFVQFEMELTARENGENIKTVSSVEDANDAYESENPEYNDTIQNVKTYTDNISKDYEETTYGEDVSYTEDENLVRIPQLSPLENDVENTEEIITGSSSSLDENIEYDVDKFSKKDIKKTEKALKKQQKLDEKQARKNVKEDVKSEENLEENFVNNDNEKDIKNKKKAKKELTDEEKAAIEKAKAKKKDPTTGLIFLHGQDKYSVTRPATQPSSVETSPEGSSYSNPNENVGEILPAVQMPRTNTHTPADLMGLPPLDEIRVPDLSRGGYSIHSETFEEINSANPYVRY